MILGPSPVHPRLINSLSLPTVSHVSPVASGGINGIVVAGELGETAGKVFRMGHMGNLSVSQVYFALDALERTLSTLGYKFEAGSGLKAAKAILGE